MEKLFQKAWGRFKKTFLRYFLTLLLGIGVIILASLGFLILAGLFFLVYIIAGKLVFVGGLLAFIFVIALIIGMWYLSAWIQLATLTAIIDNKVKDVTQCYKKTRPLVPGFIVYSLLSSLFMIGLLYTNIFFFIPFILWSVWGWFATIAFVNGHRGGLTPLWYSRNKVRNNFWKVLGYVLLLNLAVWLLAFVLAQISDVFSYFNFLISFIFSPFILAFMYELYQSLPKPKKHEPSTAWIVLSVVGWILTPVVLFFIFMNIAKNPNITEQLNSSKNYEKMLQQFNQNGNNSQFDYDIDSQTN